MNLRATLDDLDPLVAESKPATKDLAPFLRELRPLVRDAKPTVADLSTLVRRPGTDNDLVDATRKLPAFQKVASPAFKSGTGALKKSQPVLEFIRPYIPELVGWFRDFGVGAANYDANGHYARIQPIFNAFQLARPAGRPAAARAAAGRAAPRRPADRHAAPLPGLREPARRRTARRRSATPAATWTAIRPRWWPAHDARVLAVVAARRRHRRRCVCCRRQLARGRAALPRARDLRQRRAS